MRSPSRKTKLPLGVTDSPLRKTAHTSTRDLTTLFIALKATLCSLLPASMRNSTISARPFAKVSLRRKPGYFSRRSISTAACFSGLKVKERANTSRIANICSVYSGLRIRAMVCRFGFIPWAVVQQSRFTSSALVAAIKRSASRMPACKSVAIDAQFPCTAITSICSTQLLIVC